MKYDENTGIFWKIKGNEAYQKGDYERAVEYYTQAIVFLS